MTDWSDGQPLPRDPQAPGAAPRPLYWSVRRELWESRSITLAPLAVAAVVLFGFAIRALCLPQRIRALSPPDTASLRSMVVTPYSIAASVIILTAYVVGAFYCLDALHGERRDRSILFWKSLPVSDLTTVLSKASIPLVVLPLIAFCVSLAVQLALVLLHSAVLGASGVGAATLWTRLPFVQMTLVMVYGLTVNALWHAPLYAWLLLVSAWARRAPFLWAVLPFLATSALERIVLQTSHFGALLRYRLIGIMGVAFALEGRDDDVLRLAQLAPAKFLATPGLWVGLLAAAAFLAAAARLRRHREPI